MLNDAACFKAVYIVCGYTDLRSGMDRLAALVEAQTGNRPYLPDTLYLFCGRRTDRIKGLVWEWDGWLLLYKRLSDGRFQWPRSPEEVRSLTPQQFRWLMEGLTIAPKKSVTPVDPRNTWDSFVQNREIFSACYPSANRCPLTVQVPEISQKSVMGRCKSRQALWKKPLKTEVFRNCICCQKHRVPIFSKIPYLCDTVLSFAKR